LTQPEDRLVGTWELIEWSNRCEDGSRIYPLGPDATGYIAYTADGHVLVQLCATDRRDYAVNDPFSGSPEEDQAAIKSQIAYSGRYTVEGDFVLHEVTHASCPNWVGTTQHRKMQFDDDDKMTLSAEGALFQGRMVTAIVQWRRASRRAN
jgi:hypothetical protein